MKISPKRLLRRVMRRVGIEPQPDVCPARGWNQKTRKELAVLALLFVAVSGINLLWIFKDDSLMAIGDSYLYLTPLLSFIDGHFGPQGSLDLGSSLERLSHQGRPPLYQLMTIPSILIFGRSEDAVRSVNLLFLAVLMLATYGIGRLVKDGKTGLLAAFLVSTYPPIVHLSRMYLPHFALPSCVALSIYLLLLLIRDRSIGIAWLFGASLAFGLLMHPQSVWMLAAPAVLFGSYMLLFQTHPSYPGSLRQTPSWLWGKLRDPFVALGLLPGASIALGLTLSWYLTSGTRILELLQTLSVPELADFRGVTARSAGYPDLEPSFWWFAQTAPGAISNILAASVAIGLISAVLKRSLQVWVLVVTLIASYIGLSLLVLHAWMHFSAVLPIVACITAVWLTGIRRHWLRTALVMTCVGVAAFNFFVVTWGFLPWSRPLAIALGSPILDEETCRNMKPLALCPNPAHTKHWPMREITQKIFDDADCKLGRPCTLMTIMGVPAALFNYHVARYRLQGKLKIVSVGYRDQARPFNLSGLLESQYVIYPDIDFPPNDESYAVASVRFLQNPPALYADAHQEIARFRYPNGSTGRLIKRIKPLSVKEAKESITALELKERYKSEQSLVIKRLRLARDRSRGALAAPAPIADQPSRSQIRRDLVRKFRAAGSFDRLIPLYKEALETDPSNLTVRVRLGRTYERIGDVGAAIAELEKAAAMAPKNSWVRRTLAEIYETKPYLEALKIDPNDVEARVRLGEVYGSTGRPRAAIAELEKAVSLAPDDPRPLHALAKVYLSQERKDEASAVYLKILALTPDDAAAREAVDRLEGS